MPFNDVLKEWEDFPFESFIRSVKKENIRRILNSDRIQLLDFLSLLSNSATEYLEEMARKAHYLTLQHFGRVIQLYIPLYISNYCTNECAYCGFNMQNKIGRKKLSLEEIEQNAVEIAHHRMRHILLLTGEAPKITPLPYLKEAVLILKKYFASVSIEIFPMLEEEYKILKEAGVDGLTIYQETYDRLIYDRVHLSGRKKDFLYRLEAPERGARAGFRSVNIGPLFGLGDPIREAFFAGLHADYLQRKYPEIEVSISLPRLNEAEGNFKALHPLDDRHYVQTLLAFRLFLPRVGITLSTREKGDFRDSLIPLGITRMSAGSLTTVGGYENRNGALKETPQFEIQDHRSIEEIIEVIKSKGYEPVFKDWDNF